MANGCQQFVRYPHHDSLDEGAKIIFYLTSKYSIVLLLFLLHKYLHNYVLLHVALFTDVSIRQFQRDFTTIIENHETKYE